MRLRNIPRARETIQAITQWSNSRSFSVDAGARCSGTAVPSALRSAWGRPFYNEYGKSPPGDQLIGIERYSSVLLRAVEKFDTDEFNELTNVRFICMDAREIGDVFAPGEVERIYLNFSDPWPKARHARRRLTSTEFLARYEQVLKEGGLLEFKTDNTGLFDFSLEQISEAGWTLQAHTYDLHHNEEMNRGNIMTEYEEKFSAKGNPINKLIAVRK